MRNVTPNRIARLSSRRDPVPRILSAGLLLVCTSARAADLHVPADYTTITAAVAAAHARTDDSTTILIAPGTYIESGIVLDVPNLTLAGTTPLTQGPDGFPAASQTAVAVVQTNLPLNAIMFYVKATNVRITGLVLDGGPGQAGYVITIDGTFSTDGFMIDGNLIQGASTGIVSRMASGTIQGNRLTSMGSGSASFGGRPEDAKSVAFSGNLVIGNSNVGAAFEGGNGSRNTAVFPMAADGPGSLSVEVSGNEFRGNGAPGPNNANLGLSFLINDYSRSDPTQSASLEAQVHDNLFAENLNWGIAVAQRIAINSSLTGYEFEGTFERNSYCGNGRNAAIFDFRQVTTTLGGGSQPFRYGRGSTYIVHAENDQLTSIDYDMDNPANDPDAHTNEPPGTPLLNTLIFNGLVVPPAPLPVLRIPAPAVPVVGCPIYLRGTGPDANPSVLFLDAAPTASTPKYRDSAGIRFTGGNAFQEIGTWTMTPAAEVLSSGGELDSWIGLKNSDDLQTRFDLQAELYKNDVLFATGLTRCIQGVTKDPNSAEKVTVEFSPFPTEVFTGTDVLMLKVQTRIGTNPDESQCSGHTNATGLRLYFDSTNRPSSFE
jgi:hypothetical protein